MKAKLTAPPSALIKNTRAKSPGEIGPAMTNAEINRESKHPKYMKN